MRLERGRHELFVNQRARLILGAQTPFFHDHFQLLAKLLLADDQTRHAIRLQGHHQIQRLARDLLEIGRVIQAGEGTIASGIGDTLVEFADFRFRVCLNIMCSSTCATPEVPSTSSMAPLRYQTICTTVGAR